MKFKNEMVLNVSAEKAWDVIGNQFGDIGDWVATLKSSRLEGELGVGAKRVCQAEGFGPFAPAEVIEKLIEFSPKKHQFTYVALGGIPWFIDNAQNTWWIESAGENRCIVRFEAQIKMAWYLKPLEWLMPMLMKKDGDLFTEELKYRIESGNIHPRKLAAMANY